MTRHRGVRALLVAVVALALVQGLGGLLGDAPVTRAAAGATTAMAPDGSAPTVEFAGGFDEPLDLRVPEGLEPTLTGATIGLRVLDGPGRMAVSRPVQVVDPVTRARTAAPADLVAWLQDHPQVEVIAVRRFRGGGGWGTMGGWTWQGLDAVTVEYRLRPRSGLLRPLSRVRAVTAEPLFCASRGGEGATCGQVDGDTRARSTFVTIPDGGPPLLVEAFWSRSAQGEDMPDDVRFAYRTLLLDVLRQAGRAAVRRASEAASG